MLTGISSVSSQHAHSSGDGSLSGSLILTRLSGLVAFAFCFGGGDTSLLLRALPLALAVSVSGVFAASGSLTQTGDAGLLLEFGLTKTGEAAEQAAIAAYDAPKTSSIL